MGWTNDIVACDTCGLVQRAEAVPEEDSVGFCARCHFRVLRRRPNSRMRTFVFSLAALILYFPSNFYPIITAEYHGMHSETTVYQGIHSLFSNGEYFIGCLVFCT